MTKRKKKPTRIIPGLGAAQSSHVLKVLRDERRETAQAFIDHSEDAQRFDRAHGLPRNKWTTLTIVKTARQSYLHALAADSFKPLAKVA